MTLSTLHIKWLTKAHGRHVKFNEPMRRHTSLRVGGPAEAFVVPASVQELIQLLAFCRDNGLLYFVIGAGTNLLVRDEGIKGLVIAMTKAMGAMETEKINSDEFDVIAMAGAGLPGFCRLALAAGLAGANFALGIPGTVGGAICMNAGTAAGAMADILKEVTVLLADGSTRKITATDLGFCYRSLHWPAEYAAGEPSFRPIILDGRFRLRPGDPAAIKAEAKALLSARKQKQPTNQPSAGCFFKNPPTGMPAGMLIEKAGLKGRQQGGAQISPRHANFIVNTGRASATDILKLMETVQEMVWAEFNIQLEPEVKIVGQ